jgi:hypothetical protein
MSCLLNLMQWYTESKLPRGGIEIKVEYEVRLDKTRYLKDINGWLGLRKFRTSRGIACLTDKIVDIKGIQAHACRNFFVPEGKEFSFDIDECPNLHMAIKAEEGTNTCMLLCVHDKETREHVWRPVVIGKTIDGDPGIYDVFRDCFEIKGDGGMTRI